MSMIWENHKKQVLLFLTLFSGLIAGLVMVYNFKITEKMLLTSRLNPIQSERKLIEYSLVKSFGKIYENESKEIQERLEYYLRSYGLPYYVNKTGSVMSEKMKLEGLKIYDSSFRLIFSSNPEEKEIFNHDLRSRDKVITPGTFFVLNESYEIYRSLDGIYYLYFKIPEHTREKELNINLSLDLRYWIFDNKEKEILYTNDLRILGGSIGGPEILEELTNRKPVKASKLQSYEFGYLDFSFKDYHIYTLYKKRNPATLAKILYLFVTNFLFVYLIGFLFIYFFMSYHRFRKNEKFIERHREEMTKMEFLARIQKSVLSRFGAERV